MSYDIQTRFAAALTEFDDPVPEGLRAWNGPTPARRFHVYRNNVASGLTAALASRFPAAQAIVGSDFFAAMAFEFIRLHPPRSPVLMFYGDDFADFVDAFPPAATVPYLSDVIRLEALRSRAYHAADAPPLDPAELAGIAPDRLADMTLTPHPSMSVLRSIHPVATIWAMNTGEMPLAPVADHVAEDVLIVRPRMIVDVLRLPQGGAAFLMALASGATLGAAAESAMQSSPAFDLAASLTGAFSAGAFTSCLYQATGSTT